MRTAVHRLAAPVILLLATTLAVPVGAPTAAAATAGQLSIDDPGSPPAGDVTLSGQVSGGEVDVTGPSSVLYLADVSKSTIEPAGMDCDGDGAITLADDINGDRRTGDTLDCEISGIRALDASLGGPGTVSTGLAAFASSAAVADLDPAAGWTTFLPAQYADADDHRPRMVTVAGSLARGRIKDFRNIDLGGWQTNFDNAVNVAVDAVGPRSGTRWIVLLSDGRGTVADSTIDRLRNSGVRLRAFAVGTAGTCAAESVMARLATASGESCTKVASPAGLATQLTTTAPSGVDGVEVTVSGVTVAATVDAVGRWSARLRMGAGTYTADARARLSSGEVVTAQRTFTVAVQPPDGSGGGGATPPPPGFVAPSPGSQLVSRLAVTRPAPTTRRLPTVVRGTVSTVGGAAAKVMAGATVKLQARKAQTKGWSTVTRSTADAAGGYTLRWSPKAAKGKRDRLRVVLPARPAYTFARARVPNPYVFDCQVSGPSSAARDLTCRTPAHDGAKVIAKIRASGKVVDRAQVSHGRFTVTLEGKLRQYSLVVKVSPTKRAVLRRL